MILSLTESVPQPVDFGRPQYTTRGKFPLEQSREIGRVRHDDEKQVGMTIRYQSLARTIFLDVEAPEPVPRPGLTIADLGISREEAFAIRASMAAFADDWDSEDSPP